MKRTLLLAQAMSVALCTPALAQPTDDDLEEVIVTATRLDQPLDITPGAHVIDEARIEASGAVFVSDLLSEVPGVSLYSQGSPGGVTSVRLRGIGQDKTLVLLDGVPLNDPSQPAGGFDFAGLELGDIQRIEVLNGPQGSLWGSDAIGGVIALTSRELDGARVHLEAGSMHTVNGAATIGTSGPRGAFSVSVSTFQTDGVSRAATGAEVDGFENHTAGVAGRRTLGAMTFEGRLRYGRARAQIDGYPAPAYVLADTDEVADTTSLSGFVRLGGTLFGMDQSLTFAHSDIDRAITGGAFASHYTGGRDLWRWQARANLMDRRLDLVFGAEREDARGDLSTGMQARSASAAAFAVGRLNVTRNLTASLSVRLDDPQGYDAETTVRAGLAYQLSPGLNLSASWGQGFKTPTLSQSLCDFCFSSSPYPTLRPERAHGYDLGLAWRAPDGRLSWRVTAYRLEVEDEISFFFDISSFDSYYVNLARTRSMGVEVDGNWALTDELTVRAAYGWTQAEDALTGARLLRVPDHAASLGVTWSHGPWRADLAVRGESEQLDVGGIRDGFISARLAAAYALNTGTELTLRLENLTDAVYQEVLGYGEPGRAAYLGLRLRY